MTASRERNVNRHLVTVEVRIVSGADERVNANRITFDEHRLEGLNRKTVKCRRTVEQNGVPFRDFFEDVPNFWRLLLDHLARTTNGVNEAELLETTNDEWLEENESHLLGKTTLVQRQLWTDNDNGTTGVVDALTEKVLTEAALLTLEHVREDFSGRLPAPVTARP